MIFLTQAHLFAIKAHAEADYPHECGGLLLGTLDADGSKTVVETLPMENTAAVETRHDRVLIDPRALMLADRKAREKGLDIVGYYHSHPDDEAVPSTEFRSFVGEGGAEVGASWGAGEVGVGGVAET